MRLLSRIGRGITLGSLSMLATVALQAAEAWHELTPPQQTSWSTNYSVHVLLPPLMSGKNGAKYRTRISRNLITEGKASAGISPNTYVISDVFAMCDKNKTYTEIDNVRLSPKVGDYKVPTEELAPAKKIVTNVFEDPWLMASLCDNFEKYLFEIKLTGPKAAVEKHDIEISVKAARAMECGLIDMRALDQVTEPMPSFFDKVGKVGVVLKSV